MNTKDSVYTERHVHMYRLHIHRPYNICVSKWSLLHTQRLVAVHACVCIHVATALRTWAPRAPAAGDATRPPASDMPTSWMMSTAALGDATGMRRRVGIGTPSVRKGSERYLVMSTNAMVVVVCVCVCVCLFVCVSCEVKWNHLLK